MKENKIDQLFREKLTTHTTAPSAQAWELLNTQLCQGKRKKSRAFYWAAAAVGLLIASSTYIYTTNSGAYNTGSTIATNTVSTETAAPATVAEPAIETIDQTAPVLANTESKAATSDLHHNNPQPKKAGSAQSNIVSTPTIVVNKVNAQSTETFGQFLPEYDSPMVIASVVPETLTQSVPTTLSTTLASLPSEKIVLEYRASPVIQSSTTETVAQTQEKKDRDNSVIRVLEDVKQGNLGLADLRNAKNNLLARLSK